MHLTKTEQKFKENVIRIIKRNQQNIKKAVKIISELEFKDKKFGMKKAKRICILYVDLSVDFVGKPDNFDYVNEINNNLRKINSC